MVLITGASGFVGSAALKHLLAAGYRAVGTVRRSSNLKRLVQMEEHLREADLADIDALSAAMKGCRAVVHCAARSLDWGRTKDFLEVNVRGVENVVKAAAAVRSVRRFVYISTANVIGYGKRNMTELPVHETRLRFTYSRSKREGERTVQQMAKKEGISFLILRPSAVYGPEDWKWSYEMVDRIARSYWPLIDGGRAVFTPLYIENLCRAIELAIESEKSDLVLNITDDVTVSWREFCDKIADCLGVPLHFKNVPSPIALSIAALFGFAYKSILPRRVPNITLYRVIRSSRDFHYSCDRAKEMLGYTPDSDIDTHIQTTVEWYRSVVKRLVHE